MVHGESSQRLARLTLSGLIRSAWKFLASSLLRIQSRFALANLQTPGITFAITGPWENGGL
jgi:hypothetical protein